MADDHRPHLHESVFKLCWQRGYVFIAHGGGVTPIVQTVDTDLNQAVKRKYITEESFELLELMRLGQVVPQLRRERCVDLMVLTVKDEQLHLQAAHGYIKTGLSVPLDHSRSDSEICREAKHFWEERCTSTGLTVREEINREVAVVREEFSSGTMQWCYKDVRALISPYPSRGDHDAVLEKLGDTFGHEGGLDDRGAEPGDSVAVDDDSGSSSGDSEGPSERASAWGEDRDDSGTVAPPLVSGERHEVALPSSENSAAVAALHSDLSVMEQVHEMVKETGSIALAQACESEKHKTQKRLRDLGREDADVLMALDVLKLNEDQEFQRKRQRIADANKCTKALMNMRKELAVASSTLRKRQRQILEAEGVLHMKHAVRKYDPSEFGHGLKNLGGAPCRKNRLEVLSKVSRVGRGLSVAQRAEFDWFKEAWDRRMADEHKENWPMLFAQQMQDVLTAQEKVPAVAAFSAFVHAETQRCLGGSVALTI